MIQIDNKFEVGEKCFAVYNKDETLEVECPVCKGTKLITFDQFQLDCKQCRGTGYLNASYSAFDICEAKVKSIRPTIWKDHVDMKYRLDSSNSKVRNRMEKYLFKTYEKAKEYCDKFNIGMC